MTRLRAFTERRPHLTLTLFSLALQLPTFLVWRPLILPDEAGFLLNSYQLGAGRPPSGFVYFPGYSLLLAPAAALTTDVETIMWAVHLINTGLAAASALLAFALARRLRPNASTLAAVIVAGATQLYPAFRMFSALALSENLMVPASLLLAVLAVDMHFGRHPIRAAYLLGLAGGLSFVIHARSVSFTAAAGVCLLLGLRRHRLAMLGPLALWVVTAVAAYTFVDQTISSRGVSIPGNDAGSSLTSIINRSTSLSVVPDWIMTSLGQAFYLTVASGGIVIVVAGLILSRYRRNAPVALDRLAAVVALALPLFAFTFGVSVLFMAGKGGDPAIYGRYNEAAMAPVLVIGFSLLADRGFGRRLLWSAAWLVPLAAAVLVWLRPADFYQPRRQMINITAIHPITDTFGEIRLGVVAAFGVAAIILVRSAFHRRFELGVAVVAVVWAAVIAYDLRSAVRALDVLDRQDTLISAISDVEAMDVDVSCVTIDLVGIGDRWTEANYRLRRADIDFRYWLSSGIDEPPCPDLIISRRADLASVAPGSSLIAVEPGSRIGMYALPGRAQDIVLDGRPVVDQPFADLDLDTPLELTVVDAPGALAIGETGMVTVRLTNTSTRALVPHLGVDGIGGVNLGLEWRDPARPTNRLVEPQRLALPGIVWPGTSVELTGSIRAADAPIAEGDWQLVVAAVQEGRAWLAAEGSATVRVTR